MTNVFSINSLLNQQAFKDLIGKMPLLRDSAIVRAKVIDIAKDGSAVLRMNISGSHVDIRGTVLKDSSEVAFAKGQSIFLEVTGSREGLQLKMVSGPVSQSLAGSEKINPKFLDMLARLSDSRMNSSELRQVVDLLRSLPESIKIAIPGFKRIENIFSNTKVPDGKTVKAFIESSGIAFETRLKIAILRDPGSVLQSLMALQESGDLKNVLLKLKRMLRDRDTIEELKKAGLKMPEVLDMTERFLRGIEFFQLTSRMNDMFYAYLPVIWSGFRDGEIMFKKKKGAKEDQYSCDINIDIETLGRMSVSISCAGGFFYVTFFAEKEETVQLVSSRKDILENRFLSQGLSLRFLNINMKKKISFGKANFPGVSSKA